MALAHILQRSFICVVLAASVGACRTPSPMVLPSPAAEVLALDRGADPGIKPDPPRILIVVAYPDDELVAAGLTYLHGARRGGIVDVVTITDGQGTMLGFVGKGTAEESWLFDLSGDGAEGTCDKLFRGLEGPIFPARTYGPSAGAPRS